MIDSNHWYMVTNPVLHRQIARVEAMRFRRENQERGGVFYIDTLLDTGLADDFWICDMCNEVIPIDKPIPIWNNSRAMCKQCRNDIDSKYATPYDTVQNCECGCSEKEEEE